MQGRTGIAENLLERDTTLIDTAGVAPYGRVAYTNGAAIDMPLGIIRMGYGHGVADPTMVVAHYDWRGLGDQSSFDNGTRKRYNSARTDTVRVYWPASARWGAFYQNRTAELAGPFAWFGHVPVQKRDGTGLLYMRNRYYDPVSGRFTQEDPIGLAGGINLYGYANGDPINYSDPFGLNPCLVPQVAVLCLAAAVATVGATAIALATHHLIQALRNDDAEEVEGSERRQPPQEPPPEEPADTRRNPDGSAKERGQQYEEITEAQQQNPQRIQSKKKSRQRDKKELEEEAEEALEEIRRQRQQPPNNNNPNNNPPNNNPPSNPNP
jgi:RHS repeat-associated protein